MIFTSEELQELIAEQKKMAGVSFYGAFSDGYIAAFDILNTYINRRITNEMPKV